MISGNMKNDIHGVNQSLPGRWFQGRSALPELYQCVLGYVLSSPVWIWRRDPKWPCTVVCLGMGHHMDHSNCSVQVFPGNPLLISWNIISRRTASIPGWYQRDQLQPNLGKCWTSKLLDPVLGFARGAGPFRCSWRPWWEREDWGTCWP